jgi:hypothetical protein
MPLSPGARLGPCQLIQADSELDRCIKRRGEALSLFLDEEPTYAHFPRVYYYQGRVREALDNAEFAESYRTVSRDPWQIDRRPACAGSPQARRSLKFVQIEEVLIQPLKK